MAMATATSVTGGVDEYSNFDYSRSFSYQKKDNKKRGWYWRYIQEHGSCPLTKQFKQDDYDGDDDDPWVLTDGTRFPNKRKGGGIDSRGGGGGRRRRRRR